MALSAEPTPYLFACIDPATGRMAGAIGSDGKRAVEFAFHTDCVVVRWPVEQGLDALNPQGTSVTWRHVG